MKPYLILGANKSGTSLTCAVANTHPRVFCLYDTDFAADAASTRNHDFVAYFPECARHLQSEPKHLRTALEAVGDALVSRGYNFDFVGTKVAGFRADLYETEIPALYIVRDVRRWGAKNRVVSDIIGNEREQNAVPALVRYVWTYLMSFLYPHVKRVRFDDLFTNPDTVPTAVADLLGLDAEGFRKWWKKTEWTKLPPKNYSTWINGHASAFMPPVFSDTRVKLSPHPVWEKLLPIFDKYYEQPHHVFPEREVRADLEVIGSMFDAQMTLNEGYESFRSVKVASIEMLPDGNVQAKVREVIKKEPDRDWEQIEN